MNTAYKTKTKERFSVGHRILFELTLPPRLRNRVTPGDFFRVELVGKEMVLRPADAVDADQSWYWTKRWQAQERQADREIASGRLSGPFRTAGAFMKSLKRV